MKDILLSSFSFSSINNDGRYVLFFEDKKEGACHHAKHIVRLSDYVFVFCKNTKNPISIICGKEVQTEEDIQILVSALAEKYSTLLGTIESRYFTNLAKAILSIDKATFY